MVRIRLRRVGAKKQPSYRIVVADQRSPRDGRFIETIGHYNPRTQPETVQYDEERALYWLSVGAQPTEAVRRLLDKLGTYGRLERMRSGESVEALAEEALAAAEKRGPVDQKTRHTAPQPTGKKRAAPAAKAAAVAEPEPLEPEETAQPEAAEPEAEASAEPAEAEATDGEDAEAEAADGEDAE